MESLRSRSGVSQGYMVELQERGFPGSFPIGNAFCLPCTGPVLVPDLEHARHPVRAGQSLSHRDDQVSQLHQFHQNLGHVVDDSHHLALGQVPHIDLDGTDIDQGNDCPIDNHIGYRIHDSADLPYENLAVRQRFCESFKAPLLHFLLVESPNDADACQVLPGDSQHLVQVCLDFFIQGHGPDHDTEDHDGKQRDGYYEHQRALHVDGESHDHGTEDNDGRAQEQTQHQVHAGLNLVHIAGHACDHGGRPGLVDISEVQVLDMVEQGLAELCGKPYRRLGREKLGRNGGHQSYHRQRKEPQAHPPYVARVRPAGASGIDAPVDDAGHHQRHQQFEESFQELKQRRQDGFFLVVA